MQVEQEEEVERETDRTMEQIMVVHIAVYAQTVVLHITVFSQRMYVCACMANNL